MQQFGVSYQVRARSCKGGSRVYDELKKYIRDIQRGIEPRPDLLIVAVDSNCMGRNQKTRQLINVVGYAILPITVFAIPDPHIERWMLLDGQAFKKVFRRGVGLPDQKCDRDRYKKLLIDSISNEEGFYPVGGGMEFADEIVQHMRIDEIQDTSFENFIKDFKGKIKELLRN